MSKALVVVESPAKAKTIEKFLGRNFSVKASFGHLRDLPKSQFGVDIENGFAPKYINIRGKGDLIKSLKLAAKNADTVYLATDPDREGEAIAWHLAHILDISEKETCRIVFNEITKPAIQQAVKKPRRIDSARVLAQQTRRILDRIVGYKLSPLLWRKVRKGLSAGRVQSVAVRLICDREKEIQNFIQEEYWTIAVNLKTTDGSNPFDALLILCDSKKVAAANEEQAEKILAEIKNVTYSVQSVKKREKKRNPQPPFITSSLQQDAARKIGFTSKKTMLVAQQLYEGLSIGNQGQTGLITYMRTDSTRVSDLAQAEAREFIQAEYGEKFLPPKPPVYTSKNSQDAHEAVRPTSVNLTPKSLAEYLSKDQYKLYTLIWERFIASQMASAVYDTLTVDISAGKYTFRAAGSQLKFPGYLSAYSVSKKKAKEETDTNEDAENTALDKDKILPELAEGQHLKLIQTLPKQHFTEPPPRFTEASLVKAMEEKGIGRPSTYAPTIDTIVSRGYVARIEKKFEPTDLGFVVVDLLKEYFERIVNVEFTASMEDRLDDVAEGEISWEHVLKDFYEPFSQDLAVAEEAIGHIELPVQVSDVACENCGQMMVIKQGRYGDFLACPGFPKCRNTKPVLKSTGVKCPKCDGEIVERRSKRGRVFYGCGKYPECDFTAWDAPLKENCPVCGSFMIKSKTKNSSETKRCANPECSSNANLIAAAKKKPAAKRTRSKKSG